MERRLTSEELRIAAKQAITLALSAEDDDTRKSLLSRAVRLLIELDIADQSEGDDKEL